MKIVKKLILPMACIAPATTIVAPLATSCNMNSGVSYTDVTHGYNPSIEKHAAGEMTSAEAKAAYIEAIKKNPNIVAEDYKFSGGQINSFLEALDEYFQSKEEEEADPVSPYKAGGQTQPSFSYSVKSFKAGLKDFALQNSGRVSYTTGLAGDCAFTIKIPTETKEGKTYTYTVRIDANLSIQSKFVNFAGLQVQRGSSLFVNNFTYVHPIWPSDLNQEDWSLGITAKGSVKMTIDGTQVLNLPNIDLNKTFNYKDIWMLEMNIPTDKIREIFPGLINDEYYVMDVLTFLGTYQSYYMSDVTCKQHFTAVGPIQLVSIDQKYEGVNAESIATIVFKMDESWDDFDALNKRYEFQPVNDGKNHIIVSQTGKFTFLPYVDEKGVQHNDMCMVNIIVQPRYVDEGLNSNKLQYKIVCKKGDSYEWVEKHHDTFILDYGGFVEDKFDQQLWSLYSPWMDCECFVGCKFKCSFEIKQNPVEANSIFGVYIAPREAATDKVGVLCSISVENIQVNGSKFTDYTFANNEVTFRNKEAIAVGSTIDIICNIYGYWLRPGEQCRAYPLLYMPETK